MYHIRLALAVRPGNALKQGLVVTWVCCYKGFYAERMATGISRATTEAVVLSSVLILAWDYFLGSILI